MKHPRIYLAIAVLVLATLACRAVMGAGDQDGDGPAPATESSVTQPPQDNTQPSEVPTEADTNSAGSTMDSKFPLTADAYNVTDMGDGSLIYYTKLSAEEAIQFYREVYTSQGYTEREDLAVISDTIFSLVFDGDPSGKSVVIQSVDLGDGSRTIAIRLEDA